jgi:glutamate racemase
VATEATVSSGIYKHAFAEKGIEIEQIAIPPLAEAIEENLPEQEIQAILHVYINSALLYNPDIVILGCTQYPLIKTSFENFFAKNHIQPVIFDPATAVAEEAVKRFATNGEGKRVFFASQESEHFSALISLYFQNKANIVSL